MEPQEKENRLALSFASVSPSDEESRLSTVLENYLDFEVFLKASAPKFLLL